MSDVISQILIQYIIYIFGHFILMVEESGVTPTFHPNWCLKYFFKNKISKKTIVKINRMKIWSNRLGI